MDFFLSHVAVCAPDAFIVETPPSPQVPRSSIPHEAEKLLQCDDPDRCQSCARKKRKTEFAAYPTDLLKNQSRRTGLTSCRHLVTQLKHFLCCCRSRRKYQLLTRYRYHKQKKPFSAISVQVEQLTTESYEEDDLAGIPDLIEVVRLQATGPTEVARALRKKLKYGSVHRQLRALTILDGLLQNGGARLQRSILSDGPLLERLRIAAVDSISDPDVREKCKTLFSQWVASSRENPGLEGAKSLYNELPRKSRPAPQQRREQSRVLRENEEEARREDTFADPPSPVQSRNNSYAEPSLLRKNSPPSSAPPQVSPVLSFSKKVTKKDKKSKKTSRFDLSKEKPQILQNIASSSLASTSLLNTLKHINRETSRVSDSPEAVSRFETCKGLRRQILRYIQYVETEELLGGLIHANEELVEALMAFEVLDKSVAGDDDSDSEFEEAKHLSRKHAASEKAAAATESNNRKLSDAVAGLSLQAPAKPPRPPAPVQEPSYDSLESASESEEEDDDDNPFGDRNAVAAGGSRSKPVTTGAGGRRYREV